MNAPTLPRAMSAQAAVLDVSRTREGVEIAPGVHWIGALDPSLRSFDIILRTANGTTYNAFLVRGSAGVAVIDTVKAEFANEFFARLESVADYDEIRVIVLNHLEPDHSGALPELMRRAPNARLYISTRATSMLKALLKPKDADHPFEYETVGTGDSVSLGIARSGSFTHPSCIGRIPNAPIWWSRRCSSPGTSSAAIIATAGCSMTGSATSASPSIITTRTSCAPSRPM